MDDKKELLPEDDLEYERKIREDKQKELLEEERSKELEIEERKEYEKQLAKERLELLKLKNGDISESEIIKEEHEEAIKLHGVARLKNFWWHNKVIILLAAFFIIIFGYITYDTLSRTKPDMRVIMTCNNGLINRTEELADMFEEYCEDINGDGEVYVQIIEAPIAKYGTDYTATTKYQSVIQANMQTAEVIFFVSDTDILNDESGVSEAFADLSALYPDSELVTKTGLSLKGDYVQKRLKWENGFPDDMFIVMREPVATLKDTKAEMQENFESAKKIMDHLVEDFTTHYEEETK